MPEKRPFFLESTDVLDLPLAAFYSRSVTDPGWGLRATWRGASADATALTLRDDGGGLLLRPGPTRTDVLPQDRRSQATLLRGRWHGERISAGALLSQRDETGGGASNRVAGADVVWRPSDEQQLRARAMGSRSRDERRRARGRERPPPERRLVDARARLEPHRRGHRGQPALSQRQRLRRPGRRAHRCRPS